jgi:hypothetical protein
MSIPPRQPERWAVEGDALLIYNAAGAELWRVALDEPVTNNSIAPEDAGWSATVAIADLDGDGPREVLVGPLGSARETRVRLRCFDADGTLRWTRRPRRSHHGRRDHLHAAVAEPPVQDAEQPRRHEVGVDHVHPRDGVPDLP